MTYGWNAPMRDCVYDKAKRRCEEQQGWGCEECPFYDKFDCFGKMVEHMEAEYEQDREV